MTPGGVMRYRLLGRLDVFNGSEWIQLSAAKQRALLAHLLIQANHFVSADTLIEQLWGERIPGSAAKSLQVYVHRLRRALGSAQDTLRTRPGGYELSIEPGGTDIDRFTALTASGRAALPDNPAEAAELLGEALALWRGPALGDVPPAPAVQAEAARLAECRLAAWEDLADAKLAAGRHLELVAELGALLAQHPLREPLWAKLMLSLHRSGRRPDALQAYATARRKLVSEIGVEPGTALREAHRAVLTGAVPQIRPARPAAPLLWPAASRPGAGGRGGICQLPARIPDFVGRRRQLTEVLRLLAAPTGPAPASPRLVVVTGVAGAGKSTFAVHAAHLLREAFPDGQLHAELRAAGNQPAETGEVLASLLKTLGMTGAAIPSGLQERARRYRAELADRRTLVLLDNAAGEAQIRPLLPGTGDSAVVITCRAGLAGLEGALRIDLGLLSDAEALELLDRAIGEDRTRRDPSAAARIVRQCGNLPLALRIAGARLATRRHLSLSRLADALDDERRRLDELVAGDLEVRASVGLGYESLDADAQRMLRLLALLDTPAVPGWVAGALLDRGRARAERCLDALVDNHLVEADAPEAKSEPRYRLHDFVRLYARERAAAQESAPAREAALTRVYATYLALAQRADAALALSYAIPLEPRQPPDAEHERQLAAPLGWLDAERTTLCALVRQAAPERPGMAWRLAAACAAYFESAAHFDDWRETHQTALAAATAAGDHLGTATMHRNLGELNTVEDRYADAVRSFQRALAAYATLPGGAAGAREPGEAVAAAGLGVLLRLRGQYAQASAVLQRSIAGARSCGNPRAEAYARCGLGSVLLERGEPGAAREEFEQALALARRDGYHHGEASSLRHLGLTELASGALEAASLRMLRSSELFAEYGDRVGQVHALQWLGHVTDLRGEPERAEPVLEECLAEYRRFGERFGEALTLRSQADLLLHTGRGAQALTAVRRSLSIWRRLDSPYWTSRTLDLLADIHEAAGGPAGDLAAARAQRQARTLRVSVGLPAALRPARAGQRRLGGHLALPGHRGFAARHRTPDGLLRYPGE